MDGVERIDVGRRGAAVQFRTGIDPVLVPSGEVEVACHLYDEYAPMAAE